MDKRTIIQRVVELAKENVANGGWPFSAVLVKDGQVLAEAVNSVHKSNDPSDHAEIAAVRIATNQLGTPNLSGCTIYIMAPPCPMCNTCMVLAKITKVVYVVDIESKDKALSSLPLTDGLYKLLEGGFDVSAIEYQQDDALKDLAVEVMERWNSSQG